MATKNEADRSCVLLIDEMQRKTRVEFDKGLKKIVGYVSNETIPTDASSMAEKNWLRMPWSSCYVG
jgi:hypothetical protein